MEGVVKGVACAEGELNECWLGIGTVEKSC